MTPNIGYLNVLLGSCIYWMRFQAREKSVAIPREFTGDWATSVAKGAAFCKKYDIPVGNYKEYTNWIVFSNPDAKGELAELLQSHLQDFRSKWQLVKRDLDSTPTSEAEINTMDAIRQWHSTANPNTLEKIRAVVGKLGVDPKLVAYFNAPKLDNGSHLKAKLIDAVHTLTGKRQHYVPLVDIVDVRAANPDGWKVYLEAAKEARLAAKQQLRTYVRTNGQDGLVSVKDACLHLDSINVPHHLPASYNGMLNEDGALHTNDGTPLRTGVGGAVSRIDPDARIVMNPKYDPNSDHLPGRTGNWVFKTELPSLNAKGEANQQYFYTASKQKANKTKKFGVVEELIEKEAEMLSAWRKDLNGSNLNRAIYATLCELTYQTCARIGGIGNANMKGDTFGLTTLKVHNVTFYKSGKIVLRYIGKDSVEQVHTLLPDDHNMLVVMKYIRACCLNKSKDDDLWTYGGSVFTANGLRSYFREISGIAGASPHKLRHLRGTRLAISALEAASNHVTNNAPVTQKIVDASFKAALLHVGKVLGHVKNVGNSEEQTAVWNTAANNYVEPAVMLQYYGQYKDLGIRPLAFLRKVAKD